MQYEKFNDQTLAIIDENGVRRTVSRNWYEARKLQLLSELHDDVMFHLEKMDELGISITSPSIEDIAEAEIVE